MKHNRLSVTLTVLTALVFSTIAIKNKKEIKAYCNSEEKISPMNLITVSISESNAKKHNVGDFARNKLYK